KSAVGQELFNEVCQYLGLRERDFFGLYFYKNAAFDRNASNSAISNVNPGGTFRRMPWQVEAAEDCAIHHRGIPVSTISTTF
ncbi:unnamed protein product, partial [Hymenolepis diminuta]|uniref:FERM domain-containing protein n=1 Tax=Hymenolepis diminuta TaxID=6216 RepID=A0A0R3SMT3_HYMDI